MQDMSKNYAYRLAEVKERSIIAAVLRHFDVIPLVVPFTIILDCTTIWIPIV